MVPTSSDINSSSATTSCCSVVDLSVIIPAYNAEQTIVRAMKSVLSWNNIKLELIVVDDGSTDNTARIVERWATCDDRLYFVHQENLGRSVARNTGVDLAQGTWLMFLDADDYLFADAQEAVRKAISYSGALVMFPVIKSSHGGRVGFSDVVYNGVGPVAADTVVDANEVRCAAMGKEPESDNVARLVRFHSAASSCSRIFRRSEVLALKATLNGQGPYMSGLRFSEDKLMVISYLVITSDRQVLLSGQPLYFHDLTNSQTTAVWHDGDIARTKDFLDAVNRLIEVSLIKTDERDLILCSELMNQFGHCNMASRQQLGSVCREWDELMQVSDFRDCLKRVHFSNIKQVIRWVPVFFMLRHRNASLALRYYRACGLASKALKGVQS